MVVESTASMRTSKQETSLRPSRVDKDTLEDASGLHGALLQWSAILFSGGDNTWKDGSARNPVTQITKIKKYRLAPCDL